MRKTAENSKPSSQLSVHNTLLTQPLNNIIKFTQYLRL
jgi:hypothetical protein